MDDSCPRAVFRIRYKAGAFPFSITLGLLRADVTAANNGSWFAQRRVLKATVQGFENGGRLKFPYPPDRDLEWRDLNPPLRIEYLGRSKE